MPRKGHLREKVLASAIDLRPARLLTQGLKIYLWSTLLLQHLLLPSFSL
jgi:hypothetical protein